MECYRNISRISQPYYSTSLARQHFHDLSFHFTKETFLLRCQMSRLHLVGAPFNLIKTYVATCAIHVLKYNAEITLPFPLQLSDK